MFKWYIYDTPKPKTLNDWNINIKWARLIESEEENIIKSPNIYVLTKPMRTADIITSKNNSYSHLKLLFILLYIYGNAYGKSNSIYSTLDLSSYLIKNPAIINIYICNDTIYNKLSSKYSTFRIHTYNVNLINWHKQTLVENTVKAHRCIGNIFAK